MSEFYVFHFHLLIDALGSSSESDDKIFYLQCRTLTDWQMPLSDSEVTTGLTPNRYESFIHVI